MNSTSATFTLAAGVPVIALGRSVYDRPGLTHRGTLESFWIAPSPPDARLFDAFRKVLRHARLIEGDFFTKEGVARAVAGAIQRIEAARDAATRINSLQRREKSVAAVVGFIDACATHMSWGNTLTVRGIVLPPRPANAKPIPIPA